MRDYWCPSKHCPRVAPLFSSDATYGRLVIVCRWCNTRLTLYLGGYQRGERADPVDGTRSAMLTSR